MNRLSSRLLIWEDPPPSLSINSMLIQDPPLVLDLPALLDPRYINRQLRVQHLRVSTGKQGHLSTSPNCPARGKTCSNCHKTNHFAAVCRAKQRPQMNTKQKPQFKRKGKVYAINDADVGKLNLHVSEPESDDGFVFGVTDNHKAEKVSVMIGGVNVPMIIDSGASVNVIGRDVWEDMKQNGVKCTMMKADKKIYAYGSNTQLDLIGKFVADVNNQSQYEFYVTSTFGPALMSKSLALDLGVLHFAINHISLKHQIEHEYPKCFEGVGKLNNVSLKLKIDPEIEPKTQKMYRIPFSLREKVESKLEELERMDVIEKVESPSQWVSPVIVVPKPGGEAQEVEEASKDDPELQQVRQQLSNNKWDKSSKTFFPMRDELCSIGYLVLRGTRIVIPKALRSKCIKLAHTGHLGIVGTKQRLRSKVWWPGNDKEVEHFVKSCHGCQLVESALPPEPLQVTELPSGPWQDIGIDFLGPLDSGHYILVVIDYYSRYYDAEITKKTTSQKAIDALDILFSMH
ncbi:hypothetical protein RRG08_029760 [Elysia crispata]|uniref:Integrase zinc-binding domain-containing protein n=1 Tax=Elysia crispata TaxID=231223 RepID=A0AAE1EBM2_9GAST|nr:hypothetical protein RRG08_029760 [Elysia crispata]